MTCLALSTLKATGTKSTARRFMSAPVTLLLGIAVLATAIHCVRGRKLQLSLNPGTEDMERTSEHKEALDFLLKYMPEADKGTMSEENLNTHVRLALRARHKFPWAKAVPWDVFLNEVLPYRNLDEPLDEWRPEFYDLFAPMVKDATTLSEAAQILNRDIWKIWGIVFKSDQAPEILSPSQVISAGYGSCSALSIFLVDACRAVGIPARVAGTPNWANDRRGPNERFNNHNWVEVWDSGIWSFTGAAEYKPEGFNRTWFFPEPAKGQIPGDKYRAIYAASYKPTGVMYPMAWAPDTEGVPGVDVTKSYQDTPVQPSTTAASALGAGAEGQAVAAAEAGGPAAPGAEPMAES